jgi:hypothetical protein
MGFGVTRLRLRDQRTDREVGVVQPAYKLSEVVAGKRVVDIRRGFGPLKPVVEAAGGTWIGVEPFDGGAHFVRGTAEAVQYPDESFDVAIMDAVLEHVGLPDFRGQVDDVLRLRIWQASSYLIGLMFPRDVCLRWML